eukprot:TRINITY_DN42980_c0_g1_i1.p1 TRINITY_DN42980_c0_g1~~TRINITY_DN42980_c0_g1_i1.p1  ORF type:complete len:240 (-),score=15.55 TRINITY_DN42980_c0_g1_i1:24-743(-)
MTQPAAASEPVFGDSLMSNVASHMFAQTSNQASNIVSAVAQGEFATPYFNVNPSDVIMSLKRSLIPSFKKREGPPSLDLYGPLTVTLSLAALLIVQIKNSQGENHSVEGTLMGSSLGICFSYLLFNGFLSFFLAFLFESSLSLYNIFTLEGYALFGHVLVLFLSILPIPSTVFTYCFIAITVLSSFSLAYEMYISVNIPVQGAVLGCVASGLHAAFLIYLKFAYASFVEQVESNLMASS